MTEQEEEFVHFVSCISSLNNALLLLNIIKTERGNPLVGPAFKYALIEYSKAFKKSHGTLRKRDLDTSCIPAHMLALHKRIIGSRDQVLAHADLTVFDAKLYVQEVRGQRFTAIAQNLITGDEELANVEEIQKLIEGTLDNMYARENALEAQLP